MMQIGALWLAACLGTSWALCPAYWANCEDGDGGDGGGGGSGSGSSGGSTDVGQCGTHAASHPPKLSMDADSITSIRQGISGGAEAEPHSYPWMVHLAMSSQHCGGALISAQYVLTAAHCVANDNGQVTEQPSAVNVQLGVHDWDNPAQTIRADSITVHSSYKGACKGTGYDIAVIKLRSPVSFTDKIRAICLPKSYDNFAKFGAKYLVAGWGDTTAAPSGGSSKLRHTVLDSRDAYACPKQNKRNEMCAGMGDGKSVCPGDSGGPLVGRQGGKFLLVGVTSCGACGATPGWTGGQTFTHVPKMRDWIEQQTGV